MVSIFIPDRASINIYHWYIYMLSNLRHITCIPDTIYIDTKESYFAQFNKGHNYILEILRILYPRTSIQHAYTCPEDSISVHQSPAPIARESGVERDAYIYLRRLFTPYILQRNYIVNISYPEYIYICRVNDSTKRRLLNKPILKGFQSIELLGLSLMEQMCLFSKAKVIISVHGAALVHILFCNKHVKIIEIASDTMCKLEHFSHIASTLQLDYHRYTHVTDITSGSYDSDLVLINENHFEKYVDAVVKK